MYVQPIFWDPAANLSGGPQQTRGHGGAQQRQPEEPGDAFSRAQGAAGSVSAMERTGGLEESTAWGHIQDKAQWGRLDWWVDLISIISIMK